MQFQVSNVAKGLAGEYKGWFQIIPSSAQVW